MDSRTLITRKELLEHCVTVLERFPNVATTPLSGGYVRCIGLHSRDTIQLEAAAAFLVDRHGYSLSLPSPQAMGTEGYFRISAFAPRKVTG